MPKIDIQEREPTVPLKWKCCECGWSLQTIGRSKLTEKDVQILHDREQGKHEQAESLQKVLAGVW